MVGKHFKHILGGELIVLVGSFEDTVGEGALALVEPQNLLFDGVMTDKMINGNGLCLTDTVSTVSGLLFDGWIPPRVEVDDIVGSCQVQTYAACLEADKEDGTLAFLKVGDQLLALPTTTALVHSIVSKP